MTQLDFAYEAGYAAYKAGYAAFTRGEGHTRYPSSYTQEQINEWLSGYDRACEDGSFFLRGDRE